MAERGSYAALQGEKSTFSVYKVSLHNAPKNAALVDVGWLDGQVQGLAEANAGVLAKGSSDEMPDAYYVLDTRSGAIVVAERVFSFPSLDMGEAFRAGVQELCNKDAPARGAIMTITSVAAGLAAE